MDKGRLVIQEILGKEPVDGMEILAAGADKALYGEEKGNALKIFEACFLYLMDKYFAEIGFKLYQWLGKPLPEVLENVELKKKREKLKRKRKRMGQDAYKKRFRFYWYKDWDVKKEFPQKEFNSEEYDREFDEVENQIRSMERAEEKDMENRIMEIVKADLDKFLPGLLYGFEISAKTESQAIACIAQTVNIEYFLTFIRRVCSILEVELKKNREWNEKSMALCGMIFSLKRKVQSLYPTQTRDSSTLRRLTILQDILLEAESFLINVNDSMIAVRKREDFQRDIQGVLENGFKQMSGKLDLIDRGIMAMNSQLSGVNGRLTDILKVNGKILDGIIQNGQIIGSLSDKLDGIADQLSSIEEMMNYAIFSDKKE